MLSIIIKNNLKKNPLASKQNIFCSHYGNYSTSERKKNRRDNIVKENENNFEKNPGR